MEAINYTTIKKLAQELDCKIDDLIALAPGNDPFYMGVPRQVRQAKWFADIWEKCGYGDEPAHIRAIHYNLTDAKEPTLLTDGTPYLNTDEHWDILVASSKYARYLGYISYDAIEDHRNDAYTYGSYTEDEHPQHVKAQVETPYWFLPRIDDVDLEMPRYLVHGYEYNLRDQPYHLEIWCEKSTMRKKIAPICERYRVTYVEGEGELSLTGAMDLLRRIDDSGGKPTRIFYISDFDLKGVEMPISMSRKIEYLVSTSHTDYDIKLLPIVLTLDQIDKYNLTRKPYQIKKGLQESRKKASKTRVKHFEEFYGHGVTELDALEAAMPGELARVITDHIMRYRDLDISRRLSEQHQEANEIVADELSEKINPYLIEMDQLREEATALIARYQSEFNEQMRVYQERADKLRDEISRVAEDIESPLPERATAIVDGDDAGAQFLYDSSRNYFDQLAVYQRNQFKRVYKDGSGGRS